MNPIQRHSHSLSLGGATLAVGIGISLTSSAAQAADALSSHSLGSFSEVAATEESSLNNLVRRVPILPRGQKEAMAGLSAVQEQMLLHERKMRGEGLPERHRALFSANYSAIVTAIVDDRITMSYGRELLNVHRQLLNRAYSWQCRSASNAEYGDVIILALEEVGAELDEKSQSLAMVPQCVRTPIVKGHQLWIEEMLQWGCHCRVLSRGEMGTIRIMAARLDRFQGYYKRDGHLSRIERKNLHERLIAMNQELIEALKS